MTPAVLKERYNHEADQASRLIDKLERQEDKKIDIEAQIEGIKSTNNKVADALMVHNPATSWSVETQTSFGEESIASSIPASRILSTPRTGSGCFSESEVVVMGGKRSGEYDAGLVWNCTASGKAHD